LLSKLSKFASRILQTERELYLRRKSNESYVFLKYYSDKINWGDAINKDIIEYVTGAKVIECGMGHRNHVLGIGSVLVAANSNSTVWGSGFISSSQRVNNAPRKICSVRGPLTRDILLKSGFKCPTIYGDPAILMRNIYSPKQIIKTHKIGLIPHMEHKSNQWVKTICQDPRVKLINIEQSGIHSFVDEIHSCDFIASSSLHGLIAADAYGIPNVRLDIMGMNDFKFRDYYLGVGVEHFETLLVEQNCRINVERIIDCCSVKDIKFDEAALLDAFPLDLVFSS